jgi:hypothetical protein
VLVEDELLRWAARGIVEGNLLRVRHEALQIHEQWSHFSGCTCLADAANSRCMRLTGAAST